MKKTLFSAAVAALFIFASCQKEEEVSVNNQNGDLVFTATIAGQGTKTTINAANGKVSWVSGDEITVTDAASTAARYTVSAIDAKGKATLTKVAGQPTLGAGPYTAVYGTDPASGQTYSATAPALPMSAESATTSLTFTVSCGLLEITVTASSEETVKDVSRIDVRGTPAGSTETVYTLKCNTPQSISSGTVFYIALPAGNYTKVYVTNSTGFCDTTKTSSVDITANTIVPKTVSGMRFKHVKDICYNVYPLVTIGTQTWMAENLKCNKYDTESEAYNASWLTDNTIPTVSGQPKDSASLEFDVPYYSDATDRTKWTTTTQSTGANLTDSLVAKLGYLYNWAAAVGVETSLKKDEGEVSMPGYVKVTVAKTGKTFWQPAEFTGNRQGICPNGWHVPTTAEFDALKTYIETTDSTGADKAGKHLKTTSGWYQGIVPIHPQGADTYGFALLPSGYAQGDSIMAVGSSGHMCSANQATARPHKSTYSYCTYRNEKLSSSNAGPKEYGRGLRCIKD